jgi:hypothetical protein
MWTEALPMNANDKPGSMPGPNRFIDSQISGDKEIWLDLALGGAFQ